MGPSSHLPTATGISFETAALLVEELADRGFEVCVAYNGEEGLSAILRSEPDLVLCDIRMPVMSGFEVLEALTAIAPRFGQMPFVFLTALTDRDNELKGRKLGADDYVTKPIDFDLLGYHHYRSPCTRGTQRYLAKGRDAQRP